MATSTSAPIKRALVRQLRASAPLTAVIVGGVHEKVAPRKAKYPFVTYARIAAPYEYAWGLLSIEAVFDVFAWAENPVDAQTVDQLVANALNDAALSVDGQTLLLCRRVADLEGDPDIDARGRRIYQVGGTYGIQTYQPH